MSTFRYTRWDEKVVAEAEGGPKVAHADLRISIQLRSAPVDPAPYSSS